MPRSWYVYILTNHVNSVFYTGVTNNLERRAFEHKSHHNPYSFSARYRLYKLIWFEEFSHPMEAIECEKKVKDMRREKKLGLIRNMNPLFRNLFSLR